jgi:hypothetical protein
VFVVERKVHEGGNGKSHLTIASSKKGGIIWKYRQDYSGIE